MYPYIMYLFYVGAVIGCAVLLLQRRRRRHKNSMRPAPLEVALVRGGLGAVVETVIFDLYNRAIIELKPDRTTRKLQAHILPEAGNALSPLEAVSVQAFVAVQGNVRALQETRRHLTANLRDIEENMQKAGWWKTPARWHWLMSVIVPCLILLGSLRFMDYYDGPEKWLLMLTVPIFALLGRRIVVHEMFGPTQLGKNLLATLRREGVPQEELLVQVALYGAQRLADRPAYRLFCVMTRSIPYEALQ